MIPRTEPSRQLVELVDAGKAFVLAVSPNTTVRIVSTDAVEVQQCLEALQPLEDVEVATHLRSNCFLPLLEAFSQEPVETVAWMHEVLELMDE